MKIIPHQLQSILWSKDITTLDAEKDAPYVIHQILSHGGLEEFRWLRSTYSQDMIRHTFITYPYKDYRRSRFYFIKNFFIELPDQLNEQLYVRNTPRAIRYE